MNSISPGPIYYPKGVSFGAGPAGTGAEYSIASRSFSVPCDSRKTKEAEMPGPKYGVPGSVGSQVESTKPSYASGKFNASERKTMVLPPERSPGPAAYDIRDKPVKSSKKRSGLGTSERFYGNGPKAYPGPGQYKLCSMVGGSAPDKPSQPVVAFSKAQLRDSKCDSQPPSLCTAHIQYSALSPRLSTPGLLAERSSAHLVPCTPSCPPSASRHAARDSTLFAFAHGLPSFRTRTRGARTARL